MPLIKKILFPVDFSENCLGAARYVEYFAGRFEAEVTLLHVVSMGEHKLAEEFLSQRRAQLDAFLSNGLKQFTTKRVCLTGEPSTGIVEFAESFPPDLVMMPTHGLGAFRRLLLGSVTAKVLHDLDCPVWTGVHSETAPPLEKIHCRRVLCALDLNERSGNVINWAAWIAGQYGAPLGIVHATTELPPGNFEVSLAQEYAQSVAEQALRRITLLQAAAGTAGQVFINPGNPARIAACAAERFGADLLIIGRHGHRGIAGFLRQNAYAMLRDSPCPVISI